MQLTISATVLAISFAFFGLPPLAAVVLAVSWVLVGAAGGWILSSLTGVSRRKYGLLLALGPGAFLGVAMSVVAYLLVRGGPLGVGFVISLLLLAGWRWSSDNHSDDNATSGQVSVPVLLLLLIGGALLANSKEFPNLLLSGIGLMLATAVWVFSRSALSRFGSLLVAFSALIFEIGSRPSYWWWSSDDTTALSGIG
jgi:hypothetical protein